MKSKLTWGMLVIVLLLGGYSVAAWRLLRGAGAYRLGTWLGGIMASSWHFCALAAVLLLIFLIIRLAVGRNRQKSSSFGAGEGQAKVQSNDKIKPAGPIEQELIPPKGGLPEDISPLDQETVLIEQEPESSDEKTVLIASEMEPLEPDMEQKEQTPDTEAISEAAKQPIRDTSTVKKTLWGKHRENAKGKAQIETSMVQTVPAVPTCIKCGAAGKPGQRFCTKCGGEMKEGSK